MLPRSLALATDLYELTMAAAYFADRTTATATFELFVRDLPANRNYLVVAGIEQGLQYLEALRFTDEDVAYLRAHPSFRGVVSDFFDALPRLRFSGDVWALPEGTVAFIQSDSATASSPSNDTLPGFTSGGRCEV
jgi:nicotinate phosphoribosyltransferase